MKICRLALLGIMLVTAGCQNNHAAVQGGAEPESHLSAVSSTAAASVEWQEVETPRKLTVLEQWPKDAARIVKTQAIQTLDGSPLKVAIYAKADDDEYLWAALHAKDNVYDLGTAAGYHYDQDEQLRIEEVFIFGTYAVRITGAVGAAASMTHYIDIAGDEPRSLLLVDTGHAVHQDVDLDGREEIVATAGNIAQTTVYRLHEERLQWLQLNDSLQADAVRVTPEGMVEAVTLPDPWEVKRYWLKPGGWAEMDTLSQKQYEAERTGEQPYTHEQIRHVQDLADTVGVYAPLLVNPGKGAFSSAEITADQAARQLRFVYPEYTVTQSAGDLRPLQGDRAPDETLFLPGGRAEWIIGEQGPGAWYLQRGMSHVVLQANGEWNADKLLTIAATLIPIEDAKRAAPLEETPPESGVEVTKDYLFALQAAQKYASAWADRDPERGLQWVTEAWQSGKDPLELDAHFRGTSNPHHMTFELNGLRQVDADTYLFEVWFHAYYTAQPDAVNMLPRARGDGGKLVVVRQGENEWGEPVWRVSPQTANNPDCASNAVRVVLFEAING